MTVSTRATASLGLDGIRRTIDTVVDDFLMDKAQVAVSHRLPEEATDVLRSFLVGGKRIRPLLCVIGWHAAGGRGSLAPGLEGSRIAGDVPHVRAHPR
ncbi:hypothetical protein [Streptomyces luteireticuli]|uniref:hypothetical protein n=1 Tax=Streptomyces luteireticuli TaxID=173858 RepID=UPI003556E32E